MININKKLFYEVFNKDIDAYYDFIEIIDEEYIETINSLKLCNTVTEIRYNVHKLIGIINNLLNTKCDELLYMCRILLLNEKTANIDLYLPYVKNIINYDKNELGLNKIGLNEL